MLSDIPQFVIEIVSISDLTQNIPFNSLQIFSLKPDAFVQAN